MLLSFGNVLMDLCLVCLHPEPPSSYKLYTFQVGLPVQRRVSFTTSKFLFSSILKLPQHKCLYVGLKIEQKYCNSSLVVALFLILGQFHSSVSYKHILSWLFKLKWAYVNLKSWSLLYEITWGGCVVEYQCFVIYNP